MANIQPFPPDTIEGLARAVGDSVTITGSVINRVMADRDLRDESRESTKWKRLDWAFRYLQKRDRSANGVLAFIGELLSPRRFTGNQDEFEWCRANINTVLSFEGVEYGADGKFRPTKRAKTLSEAEKRAQTVQGKLQGLRSRRLHPAVLKYCRAEVMQDNYFHAALEATKGLAQRIRDESGATGDGAALVGQVFGIDAPLLAFNKLETKTERSEHTGFAELLRGCFMAVRNPIAHEPKVLWRNDDDLADYFTLISLLHYKLDQCFPTQPRKRH